MKKIHFICLISLCVSFLTREATCTNQSVAPIKASIERAKVRKTIFSKLESYISKIKKGIKKEVKDYEKEVLDTPQWEYDVQEREIATVD